MSGVAGGMAGVCEIAVTMPLDTIKTQMQLQAGKATGATPSMMNVARNIVTGPRGPLGLYSGMSAMAIQVSFKAGIRFTSQAQLKTLLDRTVGAQGSQSISPVTCNFVSGVGAGICEAAVWVTPTERLKVLRQAELSAGSASSASFRQSIVTLYQQQGVGGFFVGLAPTALRQGLAMGMRFALYGESKKAVKAVNENFLSNSISSSAQMMLAGMSTGVVSSLANQPIDTAKSRIQAAAKGEQAYSGTLDCLRKMYRDGGVRAWYAGCGPRVMRLTIGQGIIFSCQEGLSDFLHAKLA